MIRCVQTGSLHCPKSPRPHRQGVRKLKSSAIRHEPLSVFATISRETLSSSQIRDHRMRLDDFTSAHISFEGTDSGKVGQRLIGIRDAPIVLWICSCACAVAVGGLRKK